MGLYYFCFHINVQQFPHLASSRNTVGNTHARLSVDRSSFLTAWKCAIMTKSIITSSKLSTAFQSHLKPIAGLAKEVLTEIDPSTHHFYQCPVSLGMHSYGHIKHLYLQSYWTEDSLRGEKKTQRGGTDIY